MLSVWRGHLCERRASMEKRSCPARRPYLSPLLGRGGCVATSSMEKKGIYGGDGIYGARAGGGRGSAVRRWAAAGQRRRGHLWREGHLWRKRASMVPPTTQTER